MQYLELPRIHVAVVLILFLLASASYSLPTAAPENGQETANTSATTTIPPASNSSAQEVKHEFKAGSLNAGAPHQFPHCHKDRKNFTISYPGNEPGLVCKDGREPFPYCKGGCKSLTRVIQEPPFVETVCNCCSFLTAEVRKRNVDFKCTDSKGNEVMKKVPMYFPRITDCTCVRCGQQPTVNIK